MHELTSVFQVRGFTTTKCKIAPLENEKLVRMKNSNDLIKLDEQDVLHLLNQVCTDLLGQELLIGDYVYGGRIGMVLHPVIFEIIGFSSYKVKLKPVICSRPGTAVDVLDVREGSSLIKVDPTLVTFKCLTRSNA